MENLFPSGNTFGSKEFKVGHTKKVWRRTVSQLPGGFVITNLADFAGNGGVRAGMAIVKDTSEGAQDCDVKALKWADITAAVDGDGIDSLGILGFLLKDVDVDKDGNVQGTATIIVEGEIYGFMLGNTPAVAEVVAAAVKGMTQKNGMAIRVV